MGITTYFVFGSLGSVISALVFSSFTPKFTSSPEHALTASIRYETLKPIESFTFVSSMSMSSTACSCSGFSDEIIILLLSYYYYHIQPTSMGLVLDCLGTRKHNAFKPSLSILKPSLRFRSTARYDTAAKCRIVASKCATVQYVPD